MTPVRGSFINYVVLVGGGDRPKDDLLNRSHLMKKKCDPFHFSRSQDGKISRLEISRDMLDPKFIIPITN